MTVTQNPVQVITTWHAQHRVARDQGIIHTELAAATALSPTVTATNVRSDAVTLTSIGFFRMHLSLLLMVNVQTSWSNILRELRLLEQATDTISTPTAPTFVRKMGLEAGCFNHASTA